MTEFRDREERALEALDYREHILGSIDAMRDMDAEELYDAIDAVSRELLGIEPDEEEMAA